MNYREACYIVAIAQHQSLSKAAESLYVGQPTLSKFLKRLEQEHGAPLFLKCGKQLHTTDIGKCLLHYAKQVIALHGRMLEDVSVLKQGSATRLRVGFPVLRGAYLIPQVYEAFSQRSPHAHLVFEESSSSTLVDKLHKGQLDLAFLNAQDFSPQLEYIHLEQQGLYLAVNRDHPLAQQWMHSSDHHPYLELADLMLLKDEEFINFGQVDFLSHLFHLHHIHPHILISVHHIESMWGLIERNCGIGLAFHWFFEKYPNPNICMIPISHKITQVNFCAAYSKNTFVSDDIRQLIQLVRGYL